MCKTLYQYSENETCIYFVPFVFITWNKVGWFKSLKGSTRKNGTKDEIMTYFFNSQETNYG